MANSVDPDEEQSDLGLHCLPRPACLKTLDHYGTHLPCYMIYRITVLKIVIRR